MNSKRNIYVSSFDRFAGRFFLSTIFIGSLTIENTYSGVLKSLLTVPVYEDPVDTIPKFAETTWKWTAPAESWVLTISESSIEYEQVMGQKFEIKGYEEIVNSTRTHNYGIGIERLNGGGYSFGDYIRDGSIENLIVIFFALKIFILIFHI